MSLAVAIHQLGMHPSPTATLSEGSYRTLVALVYQHSRIRLGPDKHSMLASRLGKRLRTLGLSSYGDYCGLLESAGGEEEIGQLIDLISTNRRYLRPHAAEKSLTKSPLTHSGKKGRASWRSL